MELEQIISDIETEDVDVDMLAEKVKRAALLVKLCKTRLRNAEEEVKKIMAEIETDSDEVDQPGEEDGPAVE
jgi:exodeoxyribonuclease VII small subunit